MADFYDRRDLAAVTDFADPLSKFTFGFESDEQLAHNDAAPTSGIAVEISFDGVNVHGRLQAAGPSKVVNWSSHVRRYIWVRRLAGTPAGPTPVEVMATTR
jgi:hypothetical protein